MENIFSKVSYLKGLAEGMEVKESSKEGKLLLHIVDILEDFAYEIDETVKNYEDLEEYISYVDEDLFDVEGELYGFDEEFYDFEDFEGDELDNSDEDEIIDE